MTPTDRRSVGPLFGVAAGGALLAHVLAYALVYTDVAERRAHLAATGHGALAPIAMLAVAMAGAALLVLGIRAARSEPLPRGFRMAGRLAAAQLAVFVLVEVAERGFDLAAAVRDPAVRLGLVLGLVVAAALAVILRLFVRAVRLVVGRLRARLAPVRAGLGLRIAERGPLVRPRWSAASRRGPPLPLAS